MSSFKKLQPDPCHDVTAVDDADAPPVTERRPSRLPPPTPAPEMPQEEMASSVRRGSACIHETFLRQAARSPHAVAVVDGALRLTYREIDVRSNQLAHHLRGLGVGRETLVGLCLERSAELVIAILGVLKAGAAYLPLDPSHAPQRLSFYLSDARASVLVSSRTIARSWPEGLPIVRLDEHAAALRAEPESPPEPLGAPDDLAYVIYTSGSTGTPKGVMVTHHNVFRLFRSSEHLFRFDDRDVWALFHSYAFDFSVWEILGALLHGGRVVIVPADDCRALHRFARLLKEQGVTVLCQTPSAFRQLSPHIVADPGGFALRYVIFGGEALDLAALRPWIDCFGDERPELVNMYGITETTVVNTYRRVRRADLAGSPSVIGEPFPDTQLLLLDSNLEPVPIGEAGEIFLSGDCVARGYLNRPELTAERYVHWPRDGRRLYRSGDLARRLPDGEIEYLGRIDDQVKIRGFRIELGEITTHLLSYPGVSDAAVVVQGEGSDKRLVAYVVPKPGQILAAHDLQGALSQELSDYMVPSAIVFLERLPLTVNGKLDRAALPLPCARASSFRAPETRVERVITRLFSEALGVPEVGLDDDFLALGGDSLKATEVLWAIERELGVKLPFRALLGASAVADLAREVESAKPKAIEAPRPIELLPRDQALPLSHSQEQIWFHHRNAPLSPTYNESASIRTRSALDEATLRKAFQRLVSRHEALRTTFVDVDGEPRKEVRASADYDFRAVDLRAVPAPEREAKAHEIVSDIAREPFDLATGPLLRVTLVRLADADDRIFLTFHHIIMDGIGAGVLFSELETEYAALVAGSAPRATPALQEADACALQRAALPAARKRDLPYWQEKLADLPELDLPTDRPRPPVQSFRGASRVHVLPRPLVARIRKAAAQWGATPYQICLSAFVAVLQRLTQKEEVVLGTLTSGRTHPEAHSVVGCFVNSAALRVSTSGLQSFRELVARVRDVASEAYEHHALPFHEVVAALRPAREAGKHPLFQVMFATEAPPPPSKLGWELRFMFEVDTGTSTFDLSYELADCGDDLFLSVEYNTDLFDEATMSRMVERYLLLLEGALEELEPGQTAALSTLPIVTPAELETLARFSGTDEPFPRDACFHHLVEAEVRRAPNAVAAVFEGQSLSYGELDARANQLAHHLRSLGVAPETRVGLCVQRSPAMLVAILGIWKAGGAYVPLDPAYPPARLSFMVEDANAEILVADRPSLAALPAHGARIVLLDDDAATIAAQPAKRPDVAVRPDNLAYVIYTSGSTGRPKGVLVPHRGLCSLGPALVRTFDIHPASRVLQFASPSFDASVMEIIMALPAGAALVFAQPNALLPGPSLRKLLRDQRVTAALLSPSAIAALDAGREGTEADSLPLETLIAGGEPCPPQIVQRWAHGRRFFNAYGPTEATICATVTACVPDGERPPIGRPLPNTRVFVLDAHMQRVPPGVPGELYIGGVGVTRGYLERPELTAERFVPNPFGDGRLYRTGDRVRFRSDGKLEFLGRMDRQLKLRGFRIEPGEIEAELGRHPAVELAAVELVGADGQDKRLVAYVVPREGTAGELEGALKAHLRERLPEHMVPSAVVTIAHMPIGPSGKLDRAALPAPKAPARPKAPAATDVEQAIAEVWRDVLGVAEVGIDEPFFEVGGHSLALARVQAKLGARLGVDLDVVTLLRLPTIRKLAVHLAGLAERRRAAEPASAPRPQPVPAHPQALAIVGMAIRAPGVRDARSLWDVAREGRETICALDREALIAAGADPDRVRRPEFVPAEGVLEDADRFDAAFFGYSDADARLMDPQQRIFLECAHAALEHAGCDPTRIEGRIGVFAGTGSPRYWLGPVAERLRAGGSDFDAYRAQTLNAPDFLATRVAFKLGLRGPAMTVQTACSTSLSAVHLARQSLLAGDCDVALAGGVSLASLGASELGHLHAEAGILSADGHCRAFDADAGGTVKSSGVAIVVLKRLADALADGDSIHAVVLGSAMNNDGGAKIGFTAPSEDGLAAAVERAYEAAGVDPGSVGFVEAHGTGTRLGDPTEVRALTRAYRRWTEERGYCALGSLKANLGHLDAAAGAAGLMKAALVLEHGVVPPLSGFRAPNPLLDLPNTPFFVPDAPVPFPKSASPRRAGVSAMGIGGTNVHVVLEEAPRVEAQASGRPHQLLCLSARTPTALATLARRLREELAENPALDLADVAHTLSVGRTPHKYRSTFVCPDTTQAIEALSRVPSSAAALRADRPVVFLFPGHGAQYSRMGLDLYLAEPVFRAEVDVCLDILREEAGLDLRPLLTGDEPAASAKLDEMQWAQPFLFTIEYALAKLLSAWGVRPRAMLGHSLGEYVAACVAGVFALRDALGLVATRGRLMDATPPGRMLTVFADERVVATYLRDGITIATYAPGCVVLSGPAEAIEAARARLTSAFIETSAVRVSRASHSPMMNEIRDAFRKCFARIELRPPTIDVVSNVTGAPLSAEQATDPDYWVEHLCGPVRLDEGMGTLLALGAPIFIEIGPGATMGSFLQAHPRHAGTESDLVATMPGFRKREESAHAALLRGLGRAFELGVEIDWRAFYASERRRRVPLPTYPFEGRRHALETTQTEPRDARAARAIELGRELGVRPLDEHLGFRSRLEALCGGLVLDFFARLLGPELRRARSAESLRRAAGILPKFAPMVETLVEILVRTGLAAPAGEDAFLLRGDMVGRSPALSSSLRQDHPTMAGLVRFLEHCVSHYDEALTGMTEPIGILYPDGTDTFYRECMRDTEPYLHDRVYLALARETVLELIERRKGKKIRILEVGAGHGTLTWPLVEMLRDADVEYHFTDIGRSFLLRAEAEAERRGVRFLQCDRFDLNQDPYEQGLEGGYDIVLGYNSVHVARDLSATLRSLHEMLAPGGSLVLVEALRTDPWDHLTWGLAPGYWEVVGARGSLVLDLDRWQEHLGRTGFARVSGMPKDARERKMADHGLLLAERPAGPPSVRPPTMSTKPPPRMWSERPPIGPAPVHGGLEATVQYIWKRLLGVPHVPTDESFFAMGGDSLLAVQLLAELRTKTGLDVKMRQFATNPTVAGIARLGTTGQQPARAAVAKAPSRAESCLVPLAQQGTKRPFFCVHPIGGSVLCYAPLAQAMGGERPLYGLQSPMIEDPAARPRSIEELAALHLEAIRLVSPEGPYVLGGWSFGGVIAVEMARQLRARGEAVELVLLDVTLSWRPEFDLMRIRDDLAEQHRAVLEHHLDLWRGYTPATLDVPVTHFVAENGLHFEATTTREEALQAETIVPVPGDHFSMLVGENATRLAARMSVVLDESDHREPPLDGGPEGAEEASLRAYLQQFVRRMTERDSALLVEELWASSGSCVLFDVRGEAIVGTRAIEERYARDFAALREARVRLRDERVTMLAGGRTACVTALLDSDLVLAQGGRQVPHRGVRVTWILEKQADSWRAVHMHYSSPMAITTT